VIFDPVRTAFPPEKPVGMKLSVTDWVGGGWDQKQSIALAVELKRHDADWVTASSGAVSLPQEIVVGPGHQASFAMTIRKAAGLNVVAVGLITKPQVAEDTPTTEAPAGSDPTRASS
jgi:2,4-dienoyl-CoA reductase-like NADH-dependent reductase (Old Yellow Enzyme family)